MSDREFTIYVDVLAVQAEYVALGLCGASPYAALEVIPPPLRDDFRRAVIGDPMPRPTGGTGVAR